ncbi:uncharacterized protein LOC142323549 [Lycorma delicatula]|uniref:uncharacterized protein LOC142323549 n=1 Tax=Lycorma delicatula TaxID=130591 RepID=UPI003F51718B
MNYFALIAALLTGIFVCSYIDTKFLELQVDRDLPLETLDRIKHDATDALGRASYSIGHKTRQATRKLQEILQNSSEIVANRFLLIFGQEPNIHKHLNNLKRKTSELNENSKVKIKTVFIILFDKFKNVFKSIGHFLGIDIND